MKGILLGDFLREIGICVGNEYYDGVKYHLGNRELYLSDSIRRDCGLEEEDLVEFMVFITETAWPLIPPCGWGEVYKFNIHLNATVGEYVLFVLDCARRQEMNKEGGNKDTTTESTPIDDLNPVR